MGKGTILRVLEGTPLSDEVSRTLRALLPDHHIEYFQTKPDDEQSIQRGIQGLHDSFLFILDALPLDPKHTSISKETLIAYLEECTAACNLTQDRFEENYLELEKYTAKLVETLLLNWKWPADTALKDATACLNTAGQYIIMRQGRPDLATLMPMEMKDGLAYILQYDESLQPYSKQFITELETIKANHSPITPTWFRQLPEEQKTYLCELKLNPLTAQTINEDLSDLLIAWEQAKQRSLDINADCRRISKQIYPLPSWFNHLSASQQAMMTLLAAEPQRIEDKLHGFKNFILAQLKEENFHTSIASIVALPQWYWELSEIEQHFLGHLLKNQQDPLEELVSFLSSRHRTLPIPANFARHSLIKINQQGDTQHLLGKRYRSSHIASRDSLNFSQAVQQRHTEENLDVVMQYAKPGQLCLLQTLISPIKLTEDFPSVRKILKDKLPDFELYTMARAAVERHKNARNILQHNHPLNVLKKIYYTATDDPDSRLLLKTMQPFVASFPKLQELLDEYKAVIELPLLEHAFNDYIGRELWLSSLEQLIILTAEGYSYGSCVSAKDRKAIETIHTDAMLLFKERYDVWPKYTDTEEKRKHFVKIFADLYITRHQHVHAGQNATGADGIKTPYKYLPEDIVQEITSRGYDLGKDDKLATTNEVKNISKHLTAYFSPANDLHCKLTAKELGEEQCTRLYDSLTLLINEKNLFYKPNMGFFAPTLPTGIQHIQDVMNDASAGSDNVLRMKKIFTEVLARPVGAVADEGRSEATKCVYHHIRSLLQPVEATIGQCAEATLNKWDNLFEASKFANCAIACT